MAIYQGRCSDENEYMAQAAAIVLDPRLAEVWQVIWAQGFDDAAAGESVPFETLGGLLRLAYLQGYTDAAAEPVTGELFAQLGVRSLSRKRVPERRPRCGPVRPGSSDT